jgi:hypothetical protein
MLYNKMNMIRSLTLQSMILPAVLYLSGNLVCCQKGRMEIEVLDNRALG